MIIVLFLYYLMVKESIYDYSLITCLFTEVLPKHEMCSFDCKKIQLLIQQFHRLLTYLSLIFINKVATYLKHNSIEYFISFLFIKTYTNLMSSICVKPPRNVAYS